MGRLVSLVAFTLAMIAANYFIFDAIGWEFRWIVPVIYTYMFGFSTFFEFSLMRDIEAKKFVTKYMAFSGGKLILSMFILLIYAYFNRDYLRPFAASFLLVYFSFTTFEIIRLLRFFKK
jgi:hypothetical protein